MLVYRLPFPTPRALHLSFSIPKSSKQGIIAELDESTAVIESPLGTR